MLDKTSVRRWALVSGCGALELLRERVDEVVPLRRPFDAVGPVQARVEPLRRIRGRHLSGQHETDFIVKHARVRFGREVSALPAPIRPAPGQAVEHLTGIGFAAGLRVMCFRPAPLNPHRHMIFVDVREANRDTGAAKILLRKNIDRHLRPLRGHHDIGHLEHDRPVRIADAGGPRGELDAGERVLPFAGEAASDLHGEVRQE